MQLLGRVGRYGEPCQRFVWDQLDAPIDADEQTVLLARLRKPISDRRDKKKESKQISGQSMLAFGNKSNNKKAIVSNIETEPVAPRNQAAASQDAIN